ncbi:MAG: cytochrome c oxidase assembly protein [Hyphomicrobiales bacterium]
MKLKLENNDKSKNQTANRSVATACVCFVVGMVGMAYAAVPLYEIFCQVTGYGGTTQRTDAPADKVLDHEITVRFDANVGSGLPWEFDPEVTKMKVKIGETQQANYIIRNVDSVPVGATASFNVSPPSAGAYFNKLECFCFTDQALLAGETQSMPVIFFIDPEYVNDPDVKDVGTITLSYTFFPSEIDEETLAQLQENEQKRIQ